MSRCVASISGPTLTSSSVPRPTFMAPSLPASLVANSSSTAPATWKRFAAVHASPMLRIFAITAPSTAASTSASGKTMNGALPPSSIDVRSRPSADCSTSIFPTAVEPVKVSLRSRGSEMIGFETSLDLDEVSTLRTPSGSPASSRIFASASIDSGVCCAGLITIVQPAAIAGPILRVPIAIGKFHGVIA